MISVSLEQLHIMEHAVGYPKMYRNHFVTGNGSLDWGNVKDLCEKGLMEDKGGIAIYGGDHLYKVTEKGLSVIHKFHDKKYLQINFNED